MKPSILKILSTISILNLLLGTLAFGQAGQTLNQTLNQTPEQSVPLTASGQPEVYFVPNVADQFNKLALRPDALAFGLGPTAPDPHVGKHFQGIVRRHGLGTPYMYLSRSGNDVDECFPCTNDPGNIYIVRMQSRDINGERMRSNRLMRDWPIAEVVGGHPNPWPTPPDPRDKDVRTIHFNGRDGWPNYAHPGGMQMVGDILVVPLSKKYIESDPPLLVLFLDVSDPEFPEIKSQFDPYQVSDPASAFGVGQVAVAPVLNPMGPGVRYIMLLAGESNKDIRLFRSNPTETDGSTNLKSENLSWEFIQGWNDDNVTDTGRDTWPHDGAQSYQMFNFVRQQSLTGPLFMIGTYNDTPVLYPGSGNDFMDLYRVNIDQYGNPQDHLLSRVEHKNVGTTTIGGGGDASHFAGSTGVYVSPSGELIVYASLHANYGPPELLPGGERGRQTVRFGEYRHREMVRPGSPTMSPSVVVQGPFEIDEGSTSNLFAFGRPPITRAWLQLFEDDGMGLTLSEGIFDTNRWIAIDYDDWSKDNYDNFTKLWEPMNDNAGSWRWFAPPGVTIQVNQHSFNDSDFPGRRKTLVGAGFIVGAPDLNVVRDDNDEGDMDDMVSSVKFLGDAYYSATIRVAWDMDGDGTFETVLSNPAYSAALLDGPSTRTVYVQAQHPTDTTSSTGRSLPVPVEIRIRNVAPRIANLDLVDSFGFTVGVDFPFAIANVEYTAQSAFTDPGRPDHQTARLNFADGTVIQSSSFDLFSDAFGGVTGQVRQRHRFRTSGTYAVNIEVTDDDGGVSNTTKSVTVLSPSDVIRSVVTAINQQLATATNQRVIRALRDALDNLGGNNGSTAHNGALDALASGDPVAALGKIGSAIDSLGRAEAAGAGNLSNLKNLLGLAGESIAQGACQDAVDAIPTPSPGQATQLQRARQSILDGHASVLNGGYLAAIDLFRDATSRALSLR